MGSYDGVTPVLPEKDMRSLGFTDHVSENWFYSEPVGPGISLTVTIRKDTGEYNELVFDEAFGQPYYYRMWCSGPSIENEIDSKLKVLNEAGLDISVDHSLYG